MNKLKKSSIVQIVIISVLILALVLGVKFVSNLNNSTSKRSEASLADTANLRISSNSVDNKTAKFAVSLDTSDLKKGSLINSVEADIVISDKNKVLAASTSTGNHPINEKSYSVKFIQASPVPQKTICLTDVVENTSTNALTWKTTGQALTGGEKTLYDGWVSMGKPESIACRQVTPDEQNAQAPSHIDADIVANRGKVTANSGSKQATPAPSAALEEKVLVENDNVKITTTSDFKFDKPSINKTDGVITIHLHAAVDPEDKVQSVFNLSQFVTVQLTSTSDFTASPNIEIKNLSIKGIRIGNNNQVELNSTPIPLPAASSPSSRIIELHLVNTDTKKDIAGLEKLTDGVVLDTASLPANFSIYTLNANSGKSVTFNFDNGSFTHTENFSPYCIAGKNTSTNSCNPWHPLKGEHTLTITTDSFAPLTIKFTVK